MRKQNYTDLMGDNIYLGLKTAAAAILGNEMSGRGGYGFNPFRSGNAQNNWIPDTAANSNFLPDQQNPQDNPNDIPEEEKERPNDDPEEEKSRKSSSSSSSESDAPPYIYNPHPSDAIILMHKPVKRFIEINVPLYVNYIIDEDIDIYSLVPDQHDAAACVPLLSHINEKPVSPYYGYGYSNEFIQMSKCYRNVKINKMYLSIYYDYTDKLGFFNLPPISLNISADSPLYYTTPNLNREWFYDNYNNDSNIYFQMYAKTHQTPFQTIIMPDTQITPSSGPINGWKDCSTLNESTLSLNLGYKGSGPRLNVGASPIQRTGIIAVVLECEFANQQSSLGFS